MLISMLIYYVSAVDSSEMGKGVSCTRCNKLLMLSLNDLIFRPFRHLGIRHLSIEFIFKDDSLYYPLSEGQ